MDNYSNLIYALLDPGTYEVRYIGLSTRGPERPKSHARPSQIKKSGGTHKGNWLGKLATKGQKPIIRVVQCWDSITYEDLCIAETYWISFFKEAGCPLTNATTGGQGVVGYRHSMEARRKISLAGKGRKYPNREKPTYGDSKYLEKLSETMKGNKCALGSKHTEKWKRGTAEVMKGNKHALGSKHTEKWKEEASERLKGNKYREGKAPHNKGVYQTHCKHGHRMTENNTYLYKSGRRKCRACEKERMRKKRAKNQALDVFVR